MRFDVERVIRACAAHDVALEVNGHPERLDLPDLLCRRATALGARLLVNTDAHKTGDLDLMHYGVGVARRGWVEAADVLNTLSAGELRRWLASRRDRARAMEVGQG
jgi:DNA polymerase (family 10)